MVTYVFADPISFLTVLADLPYYKGGKGLPWGLQERHVVERFIYFIIELA